MSSWSDSFLNGLYWWTVLLSLACGVVVFLTGKEKDARTDKGTREMGVRLAELQTKASNALAEQQRVQTELAKAQKELVETKQLADKIDVRTTDRAITPQQRAEFINAVGINPGVKVTLTALGSDPEAAQFAEGLKTLLQGCALQVDGVSQAFFSGGVPQGVVIRIAPTEPFPFIAAALQRGFAQIGIVALGEKVPTMADGAVDILVGRKF